MAGIACLALAGFQLTRPRRAAERERQAALETVRSLTDSQAESKDVRRNSVLLARAHRIAGAGSHEALAQGLTRRDHRGASPRRRLAWAHCRALHGHSGRCSGPGDPRRLHPCRRRPQDCSRPRVRPRRRLHPRFLLSKAASKRADTIDGQMPHFVDQLAIAIEAGMSFDAALSYLQEASDGPLAEELGRIMTELRVGQSRKTALRSFADRVGSQNATAFTECRARVRPARIAARRHPSRSGCRLPASPADERRGAGAEGSR